MKKNAHDTAVVIQDVKSRFFGCHCQLIASSILKRTAAGFPISAQHAFGFLYFSREERARISLSLCSHFGKSGMLCPVAKNKIYIHTNIFFIPSVQFVLVLVVITS